MLGLRDEYTEFPIPSASFNCACKSNTRAHVEAAANSTGKSHWETIDTIRTATAANYGEARAAESRSDFIHKTRIVLKELNETGVWLDFIFECSFLTAQTVAPVVQENEELCRIFAASIKTAGGFERT